MTHYRLAVLVGLVGLTASGRVFAAPQPQFKIIVNIENYAQVEKSSLHTATRETARIFSRWASRSNGATAGCHFLEMEEPLSSRSEAFLGDGRAIGPGAPRRASRADTRSPERLPIV